MLFCMLTAMKAHSILRYFFYFSVVVIINVTISSSQKHQWNICANICSCGVIILGYDFMGVAEHYVALYMNHSWRMNCKRQPINITTRKIYIQLYTKTSARYGCFKHELLANIRIRMCVGNELLLFSFTVQGICQNISMLKTEHGT